ncbi:hypothetical protein D3H55_21555 [Bacillus salacetis]|uniref:Uncharacterized protein n=1 Tax=Bacillus salacetis TaxID=2315464 RepID=A0A3A1QQK0_9BACI|nr:hypothetical protein [Bacillus salacetis]RIW28562.1 hypothetical protein D3H55_21555 [Bacillus salacetis]
MKDLSHSLLVCFGVPDDRPRVFFNTNEELMEWVMKFLTEDCISVDEALYEEVFLTVFSSKE